MFTAETYQKREIHSQAIAQVVTDKYSMVAHYRSARNLKNLASLFLQASISLMKLITNRVML